MPLLPSDLPQRVEDVLDDNATFEPAALAAVRELARAKPWQGDDAARLEKLNACAARLAAAYGHEVWTVRLGSAPAVDQSARVVVLTKPSVVTFLHFMAAARGLSPFGCFRWSVNIFRRCFPRSFARCEHVGPFLVAAGRPAADAE